MPSEASKFMESINGPMTIGMLLRAYRTRNDLTQEQVANTLNVTKSYISDLETDRKLPSLVKTIEIATTLNDSKVLYVRTWTEQVLRNEGFTIEDITKE